MNNLSHIIGAISEHGSSFVEYLVEDGNSTTTSVHNNSHTASHSLSMVQKVAYSVGLIISVMGLVGNTLTITVLKFHKPKTVYIFFLQVLAVADGLVMFFTIGMVTTAFTCTPYQPGCMTLMKVTMSGHDISQFLSHWVLVTASLDRYLAIDNPFKKGCTRSKAWVIIAVTVLVAILLEIPRWKGIPREHYVISTAINNVPRYLIPLAILAVVNLRLIFYVRKAQKDHSKLTRKDNDHNSTRSATIILIIVVLVFLFCGLTRGIFLVINMTNYSYPRQVKNTVELITWILMLFNNAINFVIYVMFYQKFRQNLKKIFCFGNKKKLGQNSQSTVLQSKYHTVQSATSRLSLTNQSAL